MINLPLRRTISARHSHARGALTGRRGATALEFGLVSTALLLLVIGIVEAFLQLATVAALEYAALRASRFGITGASTVRNVPSNQLPGSCRSAIIPWIVTYSTNGFLNSNNLTVTMAVYSSINAANGSTGGTSGAGAGGAIVGYTLAYRRAFITPMAAALAGNANLTHTTTLLVKNEPFEDTVC